MVGRITDGADLRNLRHHGFFDALFEGNVCHAAAVAATAKTQVDDIIGIDGIQTDLALVGGQLRIDFGFNQPHDLFGQRAFCIRRLALDVGGADGQLTAGRCCTDINVGTCLLYTSDAADE